jgi:hypothetical protein
MTTKKAPDDDPISEVHRRNIAEYMRQHPEVTYRTAWSETLATSAAEHRPEPMEPSVDHPIEKAPNHGW